jgi:hypothetical protein
MSTLQKRVETIQNAADPSTSWERFQQVFVRSVALALLLTASLKLLTVSSEGLNLAQSDPVFPFLTQRQPALLVAALEAGIAYVLLRRLCGGHEVELVAWLGSVFLLYRAAAYAAGWRGPCQCFGAATSLVSMFSSWTADWLAKLTLTWMLGGSLLILGRRWSWRTHKPTAATLGRAVALFVALFPCQLDAETALAIRGKIRVQGFNRDGTIQYDKTFTFETWRGRLHWKIIVNFDEYSNIVGWDGEKTCFLINFSPEALSRDLGLDWAKYLPSGYITEGVFGYPYHCEPTTRIVWLALASSAYFNQTNRPELSAIYSMSFNDPVGQLVEASSVELLDPVGALPARVDFKVNCRPATSVTNWPFLSYIVSDKHLRRAAKEGQHYQDFVSGEYRVLRSTNAAQISLPAEFEFRVFVLANGTRIRWQRFHGIVEEISREDLPSFLPETNGRRMYMRDYRFLDRAIQLDEVGYIATNGIWPSATEAWLQELVEHKRTVRRMGLQKGLSPSR